MGKLESIEPPGQMVSFLTDPLLQKYVALRPSRMTDQRIELWVSAALEEQYDAAQRSLVDSSYLTEFLDGLAKHSQYSKACHMISPTLVHTDTNSRCCLLSQYFWKHISLSGTVRPQPMS